MPYKKRSYYKHEEAKAEAGKDNEVATDDYYRIPAIMNAQKSTAQIDPIV